MRETPRGALADYDGKWGHEVVAEILLFVDHMDKIKNKLTKLK